MSTLKHLAGRFLVRPGMCRAARHRLLPGAVALGLVAVAAGVPLIASTPQSARAAQANRDDSPGGTARAVDHYTIVTSNSLELGPNSYGAGKATCPAGTYALAGGEHNDDTQHGEMILTETHSDDADRGWYVQVRNTSSTDKSKFSAQAICGV
jgi:hypothetical protein